MSPTPPNIQPPPGYRPGQTRAPIVLGLTCTLIPFALVLASMRFYVRHRIKNSVGLDDWLLLAAVLILVTTGIMAIWAVTRGLGKHDYDLIMAGEDPHKALLVMSYLGTLTYYMGQILVQSSILATYLTRLRKPFSRRSRVVAYVVLVITSLNVLVGLIFTYVFVRIPWHTPHRDRSFKILWYINSGITLLVDLTIWGLPIPMILRSEKMDWKKKFTLVLAFSVGILSCIASLARLVLIRDAAKVSEDSAWNRVYIHVLCTAEIGFGVCAASMMPLRPLLVRIHNWFRGTVYEESSLSSPHAAGSDQGRILRVVNPRYPGESALETHDGDFGQDHDGSSNSEGQQFKMENLETHNKVPSSFTSASTAA